MGARMKGNRVATTSTGQIRLGDIMVGGVRGAEDIDALATTDAHQAVVMLWNYHDAEKAGEAKPASVAVHGLPKDLSRVRLTHYRIDDAPSNAYTVWKAMGSPQSPTPAQFAELKAKDGLQQLEAPRELDVRDGAVTVST